MKSYLLLINRDFSYRKYKYKYTDETKLTYRFPIDGIVYCHRLSYQEKDFKDIYHIYTEIEEGFSGPVLVNPSFFVNQPVTPVHLAGLVDMVLPALCLHIREIALEFGLESIKQIKNFYTKSEQLQPSQSSDFSSPSEHVLLENNLYPSPCYLEFFDLLKTACSAQKNGEMLAPVRQWLMSFPQLFVDPELNQIRTSFAMVFYPRSFIQKTMAAASKLSLTSVCMGILPAKEPTTFGVVIKIFRRQNHTARIEQDPHEFSRSLTMNDVVLFQNLEGHWLFEPPILY